MQEMKNRIADIRTLLENKILHPYLLQYIEEPFIDEDKLLLLVSAMDGLELADNEMKNYALTVMLVQIALDIHEHVSAKQSHSGLKVRQLTVLAGDYYSGLYYKHLAESDDILMIRSLSKGIKEVNEHKTLLYQKDFETSGSLIASLKTIESAIFSRLCDYFGREDWRSFAGNFLLLKRLLKERADYIKNGSSPYFEALTAVIAKSGKGLNNGLHEYLIEKLDRQLFMLEKEIKERLDPYIHKNELLRGRLEELFSEINILVEEG
ncbi:heptaprenyl diphosphate synthase component 1 [Bacillus sp. B-jedd]|uniref:heptaprenyl diphosphate synthase component 1 n=1 Tax=Bacillus sp. B-jedd TaxID=1476857 RepID=UPI0006942512|nr:heptaprenyl diphosphate synthase component 1 [Bacillus sp. B-jedd]